jgi:hypothetical protein
VRPVFGLKMGALRNNRCRAPTDQGWVQIVQTVQPLRSVQDVQESNALKIGCVIEVIDRRSYLRWVFEAKKRFGLSVLDYMVTSNHVHLLIKDTGPNVIARSMQLIAGPPVKSTTNAKGGTERFGRTVIMPPLSKPTSTCIAVSCTLT